MSRLGGRLRTLVIFGVIAVAAATTGIVWWATSDDALPFKPSALHASVHAQVAFGEQAQYFADALAGRGRLTVPVLDGQDTQIVVGTLNFVHPERFRGAGDGRLALFVIDNDAHESVGMMYGANRSGDAIASGWDGAYNALASKYSWLAPLASTTTDAGSSIPGSNSFTSPGMSITFGATTRSPVSFIAQLDPAWLPITDPAKQLTIALAYLDGDNRPRWAERLPISAAQQAPPPGTHRVVVDAGKTVTVSVPTGWVLAKTNPRSCCAAPAVRCFVKAGTDYAGDANQCLLTVTIAFSTMSPDDPKPRTHCAKGTTISSSDGEIQQRPAEYRRFRDPCSGVTSEQWTIMTDPMIGFGHPIVDASPSALFRQIVESAGLPVQLDSHRHVDVGVIRELHNDKNGCHVRIDRVAVNVDGTLINPDHATYEYLIPVDAIYGHPLRIGDVIRLDENSAPGDPPTYNYVVLEPH